MQSLHLLQNAQAVLVGEQSRITSEDEWEAIHQVASAIDDLAHRNLPESKKPKAEPKAHDVGHAHQATTHKR